MEKINIIYDKLSKESQDEFATMVIGKSILDYLQKDFSDNSYSEMQDNMIDFLSFLNYEFEFIISENKCLYRLLEKTIEFFLEYNNNTYSYFDVYKISDTEYELVLNYLDEDFKPKIFTKKYIISDTIHFTNMISDIQEL